MFKSFARRAFLVAAVGAVAIGTMGFQSNDGQDRRVRIINATGVTMTHFYASNSGQDDWEEDILGQDVLRSGASVTINIDDGSGACLYDFKARFVDGDELERYRINVCQISEYRYTAD
jgi:ABC-type glycerol-3-phosphate transport system substrate-binding protein